MHLVQAFFCLLWSHNCQECKDGLITRNLSILLLTPPLLSAHSSRMFLSPSVAQQPYTMCFRVKFYPSEPMKIKEELTRYRHRWVGQKGGKKWREGEKEEGEIAFFH